VTVGACRAAQLHERKPARWRSQAPKRAGGAFVRACRAAQLHERKPARWRSRASKCALLYVASRPFRNRGVSSTREPHPFERSFRSPRSAEDCLRDHRDDRQMNAVRTRAGPEPDLPDGEPRIMLPPREMPKEPDTLCPRRFFLATGSSCGDLIVRTTIASNSDYQLAERFRPTFGDFMRASRVARRSPLAARSRARGRLRALAATRAMRG
jgi:hypothetical protein